MNSPPLPQLQQQYLDEATLEQYRNDLDQLGEIFEVKVRLAANGPQNPAVASLDEALKELRSGTARGVRIRYRYAGQHWLDTLLSTDLGPRLTRICLDEV